MSISNKLFPEFFINNFSPNLSLHSLISSWVSILWDVLSSLTFASEQLLDAFEDLMAVTVGVDADILELIVSHLHQHVHSDLLLVEDLPQILQPQRGKEAAHRNILKATQLRVRVSVRAAVRRASHRAVVDGRGRRRWAQRGCRRGGAAQ